MLLPIIVYYYYYYITLIPQNNTTRDQISITRDKDAYMLLSKSNMSTSIYTSIILCIV